MLNAHNALKVGELPNNEEIPVNNHKFKLFGLKSFAQDDDPSSDLPSSFSQHPRSVVHAIDQEEQDPLQAEWSFDDLQVLFVDLI